MNLGTGEGNLARIVAAVLLNVHVPFQNFIHPDCYGAGMQLFPSLQRDARCRRCGEDV